MGCTCVCPGCAPPKRVVSRRTRASSGLGDGAPDPACDDRPNGHEIFTIIRRPQAASTRGGRQAAAAGHTPVGAGAHRTRQGGSPGGPAFGARAFRALGGPCGSRRAARAPGADAGARARPDPLRPDARLAVHVLPRSGDDHGARPRRDAALRSDGSVLRGRAPVELRRVRLTRAATGVRHQRLRRDAAGPLGVGRQAACDQHADRRDRQRLHAARNRTRSCSTRSAPTATRSASSPA